MKTIDEVIKEYEEIAKEKMGLVNETSFDNTRRAYINQAQEIQQIADWLKELICLKEYARVYKKSKRLYIQNERRESLIMIDIQAGIVINEDTGGYIIDKIDGDNINGIDYETYRIVIPTVYDALENVSNEKLLEEVEERMCK